MSQKHNW